MGGAPGADELPGVGVPDDDLAGLGRGVHPGDEGHRRAVPAAEEELMGGP
jgi:hypothetical protein